MVNMGVKMGILKDILSTAVEISVNEPIDIVKGGITSILGGDDDR